MLQRPYVQHFFVFKMPKQQGEINDFTICIKVRASCRIGALCIGMNLLQSFLFIQGTESSNVMYDLNLGLLFLRIPTVETLLCANPDLRLANCSGPAKKIGDEGEAMLTPRIFAAALREYGLLISLGRVGE